MKSAELQDKIAKLAAEAAVILNGLGEATPEEVEIVIWLIVDEVLLMTRETKGGAEIIKKLKNIL